MSFVIFDQVKEVCYTVPGHYASASYETLRGAKGAATRLNKQFPEKVPAVGGARFVAISYEEFNRLFNPMVTVINCLSGKEVQIRKSERGGCCDPSTERYHTM